MQLSIDELGVCGIVVDDWDITKEFKPKTITTDYSSWICYISRRPVPANIPITDIYYWKPIGRLRADLAFDYNRFKENMEALVYSFIHSSQSGAAFANEFGNNTDIGVNQKVLTDTFNRIWSKLEDITGESLNGISMVVSPKYFIGEDGCDVHITANTVDTTGIFEKIQFFINGELLTEAENVDYFEYDTHIEETSVVMCKAKILGIEYMRQNVVTHYSSFWLGAGTSYRDIMVNENLVSIGNNMRGAYDVAVNDGDRIIIIIGASLREGFIRADMNGAEILFDEYPVTVYGNEYVVFASKSTYIGGTYNIDING